mmetsp:Transcript_33487/g.77191  ORF Transcript_33487/g.77191 Transcript_33487/m.77191 type:complete len:264 (-) Transcript_33487:138-929(-)
MAASQLATGVEAEAPHVLTQLPCERQLSFQRSLSALALAGGLALAQSQTVSPIGTPPASCRSGSLEECCEGATSSTKAPLFRTNTVGGDGTPASMGGSSTASSERRQAPASLKLAASIGQEEELPQSIAEASQATPAKPRPILHLPIQPRNRSPSANHRWFERPSIDEDSTPLPPLLPPLVAVPPGLPTTSRKSGGKTARALPARLHQLDDQTVIPREVHNRMLQLGDSARGSLGYGQHRLVFVGCEGRAVLRREVIPAVMAH